MILELAPLTRLDSSKIPWLASIHLHSTRVQTETYCHIGAFGLCIVSGFWTNRLAQLRLLTELSPQDIYERVLLSYTRDCSSSCDYEGCILLLLKINPPERTVLKIQISLTDWLSQFLLSKYYPLLLNVNWGL